MTDAERDLLFSTALKYCRMRLLPFDELDYAETCEYGLRRSRLHSSLAKLIDADRELVEGALERTATEFGRCKSIDGVVVDGSYSGDFSATYDAFCKELVSISEMSDSERHPYVLDESTLNEVAAEMGKLSKIPSLSATEGHEEAVIQ